MLNHSLLYLSVYHFSVIAPFFPFVGSLRLYGFGFIRLIRQIRLQKSFAFCSSRHQLPIQRLQILRRVNAAAFVFRARDVDFDAVFEEAQLFELFDAFQTAGRPIDKLQQCFAAINIHAEVLQIWIELEPVFAGFAIAAKGNGRAGEIERGLIRSHDDFHDVRILQLTHAHDRSRERAHFGVGIRAQNAHREINRLGRNQRLIALNIDDDIDVR